MLYSCDSVASGRKLLELQVLKFGNGEKRLFLGIIEDGHELTEWPVGEIGCNLCLFSGALH
jgi:hypothetical protein